jgi:hypothetical protein
MKPTVEKKQISEGIISKFIEKFFDSYKRGLEKQFIAASRQRDPELGDNLDKADQHIQDAIDILNSRAKRNK